MIVRFDSRAFGYHHSGRRMSATVFGSGGGFCTTAAVASCAAAAVVRGAVAFCTAAADDEALRIDAVDAPRAAPRCLRHGADACGGKRRCTPQTRASRIFYRILFIFKDCPAFTAARYAALNAERRSVVWYGP